MHIAHRTRSRCSIEMANASSQSCIGSSGGSSQVLHSFLDVDLEADDVTGPSLGALRGNSRRPRFPPY